jgi:hypothetical protein
MSAPRQMNKAPKSRKLIFDMASSVSPVARVGSPWHVVY